MAIENHEIWMVVVGFIVAFLLALGIGANDVANTFGTSVGAKVLTLRQACILATIFETLGAVLIGAKVSDTVRKGIVDSEIYSNQTELFMVGNVAALSGSAAWLALATFFKMPVSGTHSIIGAIMGFALVSKGPNAIQWSKLGMIIASWFISPALSGAVSLALFVLVKYLVILNATPLEAGLRLLPLFYGCTLVINAFSVFYEGPEVLYFHVIPLWGVFILAFGIGGITGILVKFILVPKQRRAILAEVTKTERSLSNGVAHEMDRKNTVPMEKTQIPQHNAVTGGGDQGLGVISSGISSASHANEVLSSEQIYSPVMTKLRGMSEAVQDRARTLSKSFHTPQEDEIVLPVDDPEADDENTNNSNNLDNSQPNADLIKDRPETARLFSFLQILTAIFGAFAHGGNDVSNAIGPIVSIYLVAQTNSLDGGQTPIWILLIGGAGISVGLWVWGRRVIETMGEELTAITPSSGFCIEVGAAISVLVASNVGIPVSSTHCKVGSIVVVGRYRSKENVDWKVFRNIVLAWVLTLPATGIISALVMLALQEAVPH